MKADEKELGTNTKERSQVGDELVLFLFWLPVQAFIIMLLESLNLLPSDFLKNVLHIEDVVEWEAYMHTFGTLETGYTFFCMLVGIVYTFVGCLLISEYGACTKSWWKKVSVWYLIYVPCATCLFLFDFGPVALADVLAAPLLWFGEIALLEYCKGRIHGALRKKTEVAP